MTFEVLDTLPVPEPGNWRLTHCRRGTAAYTIQLRSPQEPA
jgi:hypothetical protein